MTSDAVSPDSDQPQADFSGPKVLFIICTLKRSPEVSHAQGSMDIAKSIMEAQGVETENIWVIDHDIADANRW